MSARMPDVTQVVLVCQGCHHWQVDATPRAKRELGGGPAALGAVAPAPADAHRGAWPAAGGRVKGLGQWVERPEMSSGNKADGLLGAMPLPDWWVWR